MPQIVVEGLVKTYRIAERRKGFLGAVAGLVRRRHREVRALDGISFSLEAGELVGYVGPNGAGKSTTIKILSGILVPDSGRVEVLGRTPWIKRKATVGRLGVVFGQRTQLWWDLPVVESFDLMRDIYRVPRVAYERSRDELIERLALADLLDTPVRQLSLGQRMRCDLAAALLHEPDILFLDEPTIGLDATSKLAVRDFIERINRDRGVTVILTTHDMDDIERLCPRVIVLHEGGIFLDGTLAALRARVSRDRWLIVDLEDEADAEALAGDPDGEAWLVKREGHRLWLGFDPERTPAASLIARVGARYAIRDLTVENPEIETIIAQLYDEAGTVGAANGAKAVEAAAISEGEAKR